MAKIKVKAKPPINVEKLVIWSMTDEDNETYGEALDFDKRFMTYTDSIATNSVSLYGCGVAVDKATSLGEGSLSYGIHAFTAEERVAIFGETKNAEKDIVVTTGNEIIPYVATAHMTKKRDGKVNLYKYFKVQFPPNEDSVQQISDGNITYSTLTINGTYVRSESQDAMRAIAYDVDPESSEGKTLIEKWFSQADYIGADEE